MTILASYLVDVETRMKRISADLYSRLADSIPWQRFAKLRNFTGRKERLVWLLDQAKIEYVDRDGADVTFDELAEVSTEITSTPATAGLKIKAFDLEDQDGGGLEAAAHWSRTAGHMAAYWPAKQVFKAIRDNTLVCYDTKVLFATDHPLNPFDTSVGTFANDFTGAAASTPSTDPQDATYPGALDLSEAVTLDVALQNLMKATSYIHGIRMPNGEDPRRLKVVAIVGPHRMAGRLAQLTNAEFISQASTGGAGSADVKAYIRQFGLPEPIIVDELGAAYGGSDTTCYLLVEAAEGDEMGALIYGERQGFEVVYHGLLDDAQLARINEFQWVMRGRNSVSAGHPYLMFRLKAA